MKGDQSNLIMIMSNHYYNIQDEIQRSNLCFFHLQGLRVAAILGAFGTCLGAWVKVFSVQPHLFWLSFLGQGIVATAQVTVFK
jgi:hypothetical protein